MSKRGFLANYNFFKHIPDDLVIQSTPGMIISLLGTVVMLTLFVLELNAYFQVSTSTTLVVDELVDDMLRANFNVTLHQVPCEYLSVDIADMTGSTRHNVSKDILKWRLDSSQRVIAATNAVAARTVSEGTLAHETHDGAFDVFDPDEYEPPDTNLSEALTAETFNDFLQQHELTAVNFFAPWCIWCRRFEPVYLEAAQKIPELHFHGHARLAQVDCVANQAFCGKNMVRAYPTVRMYRDGDPVNFELFTGARTVPSVIGFIQQQMDLYKVSHRVAHKEGEARFVIKHCALSSGSDLYRARLDAEAAQTYCGSNLACAGFTWQSKPPHEKKDGKLVEGPEEAPLVYFKGHLNVQQAHASMNTDDAWTAYIKLTNASHTASTSGSLKHGPEGCRIAGHLNVRKVPGTLKLLLHTTEHDHDAHLINSSHVVDSLWFGEPLSRAQRLQLPAADQLELLSPTSHRLDGLPFISAESGHSHVHYLKVVTKVIKHQSSRVHDTLAYKYTVHSNRYEEPNNGEPLIEFKYDLSPISIVVQQERVPAYKFITSSCAIIGGVFTVIGLLENVVHHTASALSKKTI